MATYKIKRYSYNANDNLEIQYDSASDWAIKNRFTDTRMGLSPLAGIGIAAIIGAFIYGIVNFFKSFKSASKYNASAQEIEAIRKELPVEFDLLRDIKNKVIHDCPFMFSSNSALNFFTNCLPSLLNLNSEGWIAGWARETGKKGIRWAPFLSMYQSNFVLCWDFDNKYWFVILDREREYKITSTIWDLLLVHFLNAKDKVKGITDWDPNIKKLTLSYLDLNIKLLKKNSKVKTGQKNFAIPITSAGVNALKANNVGIMPTFGLRGINRAITGIGKSGEALTNAQRIQAGVAGAAKLGATGAVGYGAYKLADASTGESASKQMEFSNKNMATYRLKRKTFGMAFAQTLAKQAATQGKGMGNLTRSFGSKMNKYTKSGDAFKSALSEWSKTNKGGARDFIKTAEGGKLWNARLSAKADTNKVLESMTQKAGMGTLKEATGKMVNTNMIQKQVGAGQGIMNTWNSGAMGKAKILGSGAALVGTGVLAGKALGGNNQQENTNNQ